MNPENDSNISRVESLEQITGLKPVDPHGRKKHKQNTAKKKHGKAGGRSDELIEQTELEDNGQDPEQGHTIDYCA